jgi:glucose 1-dehydrogenase
VKPELAELHGKVALVTGGAIRIGRAISMALAHAGCDLFIHYNHSHEAAKEAQAEAQEAGVRAEIYSADLSESFATEGVIAAARETFGRVDILVNSAALFLEGDLRHTTLDTWERQFAVNLRAPFLLSRAFAAQGHFSPAQPGNIININDARIFRPGMDHFAYRLTKTALFAMTEGLALELAPNVRVNGVALGAILPPPGEGEGYLARLARERVPLRRSGNAQLVAENVLHLLRQPFITGHTIRLDGGEFL